jgi:hypothetical protein
MGDFVRGRCKAGKIQQSVFVNSWYDTKGKPCLQCAVDKSKCAALSFRRAHRLRKHCFQIFVFLGTQSRYNLPGADCFAPPGLFTPLDLSALTHGDLRFGVACKDKLCAASVAKAGPQLAGPKMLPVGFRYVSAIKGEDL